VAYDVIAEVITHAFELGKHDVVIARRDIGHRKLYRRFIVRRDHDGRLLLFREWKR